jgi:transposase-like protein
MMTEKNSSDDVSQKTTSTHGMTDEDIRCPIDGCDRVFGSKYALASHRGHAHADVSPWRDKERLKKLYLKERLTTVEMADRMGCSPVTIQNWLSRHGIEKRESRRDYGHDDYPWRNEDVLRTLYEGKGLSSIKIAEKFDCDHSTVCNWLEEFGIKTRDPRKRPVYFETDIRGYEHWRHKSFDGDHDVKVHRLLAVAKYGFQAVTSEMDVHHQNGVPWDNRYQNIEVVDHAEHTRIHNYRRNESGVQDHV